ncbi:uncharacterized protein PHACADRAFT_251598 [Phanerochaete carnosa HHB-10118-sp]|uniref:Uncharacterized protein n=1 Tax=Phanerochaete carnosa (strain HHB-10118-sp) TaxID=650164 RepID=K5V546_PHACS|nr:uncharacterized protein PHACADRAFT_251598 [Phanerochaete carnosa HHB-10118-sp]EKM57761.1 hypothetical protein PHACADRAFT_251598 [Phanerochaete carnosa HHB-10118-sp]
MSRSTHRTSPTGFVVLPCMPNSHSRAVFRAVCSGSRSRCPHCVFPVTRARNICGILVSFRRASEHGKARATATDDSEVDIENVVTPSRPGRHKPIAKSRLAAESQLRSETEPEVEEIVPSDLARPNKRLRVRLSSPVPPSPKPTKIRLRLPARKGKERAEDPDDGKKGIVMLAQHPSCNQIRLALRKVGQLQT